ncbi:MAG TPA: type II secretion system F family protein [Candidatus Desulfobacillus sp.]|nr:type II secretion system F family protein [Candidatus Desulfobacillus sp.]
MALFSYKAMNTAGRIVHGRLDAINLVDLELRLRRMELDFINGGEVAQGGLFRGGKVPKRELINFCFHMEQLTRAGVPILEGLGDLRDSLSHPRFREVIASMIESIEGGRTLSQAMAEHPKVFDKVFSSLIRAGENTGNLPEVLKSLNDSLKWEDELASHTKKLFMYPAFVGSIILGVTFFLMVYLVPQMAGFIKNMGQALPTHTRLLLATSAFFQQFWYLILLAPLLIGVAVKVGIETNAALRRRFDEFKLALPIVGPILRKIILSRFASVFAMMYASGIAIIDAIRVTEDVVGNAVIRDGLRRVGQLIGEGQNVTVAFQNINLFPPLVVRMLKIGENTGELDTALLNVSYFYNRDVKESIEKAQAMIEPMMTVILGSILGWIMLSVLGPIYDVITKLKI